MTTQDVFLLIDSLIAATPDNEKELINALLKLKNHLILTMHDLDLAESYEKVIMVVSKYIPFLRYNWHRTLYALIQNKRKSIHFIMN